MPQPYIHTEEFVASQYNGQNYNIHVLRWTARNASGLPPVVCVHGLTRRAEDYIHLAEALSEKRDVYSFSMLGRGKSDHVRPELYVYPQYVKDCLFLLKHYGLESVDWVGTSMGGIIAFLIAGAEGLGSSQIRRLALNDVGPYISASSLQNLAIRVTGYDGRPFKTWSDAEAYCRFSWEEFGIDDPEHWAEFVGFNIVQKDSGFYLHYDAEIVKGLRDPKAITDMNLWSFYCRITCPTLVLHGEHSRLLLPETMAEMARHGPRPKFVTFSGCGHAPALIDPQQIGAVAGFLDQP